MSQIGSLIYGITQMWFMMLYTCNTQWFIKCMTTEKKRKSGGTRKVRWGAKSKATKKKTKMLCLPEHHLELVYRVDSWPACQQLHPTWQTPASCWVGQPGDSGSQALWNHALQITLINPVQVSFIYNSYLKESLRMNQSLQQQSGVLLCPLYYTIFSVYDGFLLS